MQVSRAELHRTVSTSKLKACRVVGLPPISSEELESDGAMLVSAHSLPSEHAPRIFFFF